MFRSRSSNAGEPNLVCGPGSAHRANLDLRFGPEPLKPEPPVKCQFPTGVVSFSVKEDEGNTDIKGDVLVNIFRHRCSHESHSLEWPPTRLTVVLATANFSLRSISLQPLQMPWRLRRLTTSNPPNSTPAGTRALHAIRQSLAPLRSGPILRHTSSCAHPLTPARICLHPMSIRPDRRSPSRCGSSRFTPQPSMTPNTTTITPPVSLT